MIKRPKVISGSISAVLLFSTLAIVAAPSASAANATPSPTPKATSTARPWSSNSATPRPQASSTPTGRSTSTPAPSPAPTVSIPVMNAVYADTNVPQIISIEAEKSYSEDLFTLSFLIKARIHRNTIQSLALEFKPKTAQGSLLDPIFQAPCTKIGNVSISSLTNEGNSTALQRRSQAGDWYLEDYVLQSKTKLAKNTGPCPGTYLITALNFVDSAKHTLEVDANLASTVAATTTTNSSTGVKSPTTPARAVNTDTAIMQSNVWNSRIDLAPCVAGTNLAPVLTNVVVQGKTSQVFVAPTIAPTNRVACAPTIGFNLTNTLFSVAEGEYFSGKLSDDALKIFDYATEVNRVSGELSKLSAEMATLVAQNALLVEEIARLKTPAVVTPTPKPTASSTKKPTPKATKKATVKSTKKPTVKKTPTPKWSRPASNGKSTWRPSSQSSQQAKK